MPTKFEHYVKQVRLDQLFKELQASNSRTLSKTVRHFTIKEAEKRDRIVNDYFGERGINRIVETVAAFLLERPGLPANAKVLDVGAGTGFFTVKIAEKMREKVPKACFYAMDLTPAMLLSLAKKNAGITPFIGIAENVEGSIAQARSFFKIPLKFDAIFSTLMLHHSTAPERFFQSVKAVLKNNGRAMVIDLCEHDFEEFRTEMGDVHLGFKPEAVYVTARKYFSEVKVEKMPGIRCESSGRSAEIFVAKMRN